jgi:hypothetical protein
MNDLQSRGVNILSSDQFKYAGFISSTFKVSDHLPALSGVWASNGFSHSENYAIGAFPAQRYSVFNVMSGGTTWAFLYRYLPGLKSNLRPDHGLGFAYSFVPVDAADSRTGMLSASNPNGAVTNREDTGLNCHGWTQPVITAINTAQYDLKNPSFYSTCDASTKTWVVKAEVDSTYIDVNWVSFQFKGDYLPKTATIEVTGLTNTSFSCADWNMPLLTGWWVGGQSENMQVFPWPVCVNNYWQLNPWQVNNYVSAGYLFISKRKLHRSLFN